MFFTIGAGSKDSDMDGVADELDKCPNTPKGFEVNESDCPVVIEQVRMLANNIYIETVSDVLKVESN